MVIILCDKHRWYPRKLRSSIAVLPLIALYFTERILIPLHSRGSCKNTHSSIREIFKKKKKCTYNVYRAMSVYCDTRVMSSLFVRFQYFSCDCAFSLQIVTSRK